MLEPGSIDELQNAVREHPRVLPIGGLTKSRLTKVTGDCVPISTQKLTGILEYDPSEYTFTALAGTPVQEIYRALEAKGQFLPCSALLRNSGATLGGSIASGLSGPGRFRFGGLRDFLLGIRYVSGDGELVSAGGKVVKNAAGFDLPKFMVGSLGRFGILSEVTFKVFPKPSATITMKVACASHDEAVERIFRSASARWELYAIDYDPADSALYLRLGGPLEAIRTIADEIQSEWTDQGKELTGEQAESFWNRVREFEWVSEGGVVAKVPITPKIIPKLQSALDSIDGVCAHYSVAGNVAFISATDAGCIVAVSETLSSFNLRGMTIFGDADTPLWLGDIREYQISADVKGALDPHQRFPSIHS